MPRRRSQTQLTTRHQEHQPDQSNPDYTQFRNQVNAWFQDVFQDTDSKTGYLIKAPKGFYGSRLKQLVRYVYQQSNEIKAIQTQQQIRSSSLCLYIGHVITFLSVYVLPILLALTVAYLYYSADVTPIVTPSPPLQTDVITVNSTDSSHWYSVAQGAGNLVGNFARNLLSVPVGFAASTVDRVLHVQEGLNFFQTYGYRFLYAILIGFSVYLLTLLVLKLLLNIHQLVAKQWTLWSAQQLFLRETEETIERAITSIVRPFLIKSYEQLLCQTSEDQPMNQKTRAFVKRMYLAYNNDLNMLRESLFERAETHVKAIPFSELLNQGQVSKQYLNGLYRLIRDSDQQLSMLLFDLNHELARIPTESKRLLMN
jgi:hypothetical protein